MYCSKTEPLLLLLLFKTGGCCALDTKTHGMELVGLVQVTKGLWNDLVKISE